MNWRKIPCSKKELRLDLTLVCGQSFRWQETTSGEWRGVLAKKLWTLSQTDSHILYTAQPYPDCSNKIYQNEREGEVEKRDLKLVKDDTILSTSKELKVEPMSDSDFKIFPSNPASEEEVLRDYFQLDVKLSDLYEKWSSVDTNFKSTAANFEGVRILRQDPVENLFAFICSSNNHISRISNMVEKLCSEYGEEITTAEDKTYYSFPSVRSLSGAGVEKRLRELGFGYRAKYISESAKFISNHKLGEDWLWSLRSKPYMEAKKELLQLNGVGGKVADCVCLMSLDKTEAVPVDTHVWQIALRDYMPKLRSSKSLTDKLYLEIGDYFRDLWGDYAGWAHSVLFSADLRKFKDKLPVKKETEAMKRKKTESMQAKTKKSR